MITLNPEESSYFRANTAEDLLYALENKENYIIVTEDFRKEFERNTQLPLPETEQMGANLGSGGSTAVTGEVLFRMLNFFGKGSRQQKEINKKIRSYQYKQWNDNELLLYRAQLEY